MKKAISEKFVLTTYTILTGMPGPEKPVTAALLADMHEHSQTESLRLLKELDPDLIFVAGDSFERRDQGEDPRYRERSSGSVLRKIKKWVKRCVYGCFGSRAETDREFIYQFLREAGKLAPVFLSLGNHEWYLTEEDRKELREAGVTLLDNSDIHITVRGCEFWIGGLSPDVDERWLKEFASRTGYKILLCHHPEYYERYLKTKKIQLILSGHAHGGQWRIGNHGLFAPDQGLWPKYTRGVYDGRLVVSAGCADTAWLPRFGNPCEVVALELAEQ